MIKQLNRQPQRAVKVPRRQPQNQSQQQIFSIIKKLRILLPHNKLMLQAAGVTLFVVVGACIALLTPIWSGRDRLNLAQQFSLDAAKSPKSDWSSSLNYQLTQPLNILIMEFDSIPGKTETAATFNRASNALLLLRLDPQANSIKLLSIPQNTQVVIPGIGLTKISAANARGGPALAARVVSRTLNNLPIDRYVQISTNGLRELVDFLGGVEVLVPQKLSSVNESQLDTELEPGWQTLNGYQAQQFAQFKDAVGDIGRVKRQQLLLKALFERLNSPTVLPRLPQLSQVMLNYVDTNLSLAEMTALVNFSAQVEPQNFRMELLPGSLSRFSKDPSSYWLDWSGKNRLLQKDFGIKGVRGEG